MKAILQVGPAQLVVEGPAFHLLCEDIQQTLAGLVALQASSITLTLHVGHLETCLAEDARRLNAAVMALPKYHLGNGDGGNPFAGNSLPIRPVTVPPPQWRRHAYMRAASPPPHHLCPSTIERRPVVHKGPFFIFSAASFDRAEAVVQQLHACLLEQRLLLDDMELHAMCDGGDGLSASDTSPRVLPLPIIELDTYLSTSANVMAEYDAEGHRRRSSTTVVGVAAARR
ncbi:hypothetical protein LSCM1_04629 [Leishmania martiniquensis]|uniref:Uncharacterized protein n=1 Tax=Leishmania martiniquensis TaxID=1580590 RepID=A0A836GSM5_9TRYP|nr:hypothetical protein LSCM1_04629 [Leishmania martiniquensis]